MVRRILGSLFWACAVSTIVRPVWAEITAEQVRNAMDRGRAYLKSQQNKVRGNWVAENLQPGGVTALCTLALLNSGDSPEEEHVQRALAHLRKLETKTTYAISLQTMVFCAADPRKDRLLIRRNARLLESMQVAMGDSKGAWGYSKTQGKGDRSNTQFALLALSEAERVGVEVSDQTWRLARDFWLRTQRTDGSWSYFPTHSGSGSMTCAGIASLVITSGQLSRGDAAVVGGQVQCCGEQQDHEAFERALQWMGRNFSVHVNPSRDAPVRRAWLLYYLYGVERVGRMTGRRFIGRHDWYREGAEMLVSQQDTLRGLWKGKGHAESSPNVATAFALLFLSKGSRPVLIAKLKRLPADDWNHHRSDIANLTRYVEQRWGQLLTWQVIDSQAATPEDLLQAPVLFITGRSGWELTDEEQKNLRTYVDRGGFIFAETCCQGDGFDRQFRRLMKDLFPESPLRLLPPDHPVWFAEEKVDPKYMPELYGIDACCRTSVVYCPEDLSCYWELGRSRRDQMEQVPPAVQAKITARYNVGANVLTYATGRELKSKLDGPQSMASPDSEGSSERGVLSVPTLRHSGGSDDAPAALANLLDVLRRQLKMRVSSQRRLLAITDQRLLDYPIVFMHGRRQFRLTAGQREALTTFLERGGVIFADAICASPEFTASFRREMKTVFPDARLERIPTDHPMFSRQYHGFDVTTVTRRDPQIRAADDPLKARLVKVPPLLEGIQLDDRYAVIFSPYDISCALENTPSLECKGYVTKDAARIGVNVILYALQQ